MKISEALALFSKYQKSHLRPRTVKGYKYVLSIFEDFLGDREIEAINEEEIYQFLDILTENLSRGTKRLRYTQIKAFFNFCINYCNMDIKNPCNATVMKKLFRNPKPIQKRIIPKGIIDEAIFVSKTLRDRLILELQARCGLRIGEVLSIREMDIDGRKILIHNPKSGKESEVAFMPEQVAKRLKTYINQRGVRGEEAVFKISYSGARKMINKLGDQIGIKLNPHDLRRHSAT